MADVWVVTGGIGSGKSTIRRTMGELGAVTIDADRVGHEVLEPDGAAFSQVAATWPSVVVDGHIDRLRLAAIVFADEDELQRLESISHPAIAALITERIAEAAENDVVVVEISVPKDLLGVGWLRTIVADLPDEERVGRLVERGMDRTDVERRMRAQPSRDEWQARGRWIVPTSGSREAVERRVRKLYQDVIRLAR
ncbi:MAG: dephospho-CoA kinase [Acidimicrobiia bacterium]